MAAASRTIAALITTMASAVLLAGCIAAPAPEPSSAPQPTPAPIEAPDPVDPLTTVDTIVVRAEALELRDADDVIVSTLSYDDDAATFVGTLATVLGSAPSESESTGSMETPPSTSYHWDGLRVTDDIDGTDKWPAQIDMNLTVYFTAPVIGDGVNVRTFNGFQPGGDSQALAAELGEPWSGNGYDQVRVESGEPIGEQNFEEYENAYSVAVNSWEWEGTTAAVFAPWNFGIGHV